MISQLRNTELTDRVVLFYPGNSTGSAATTFFSTTGGNLFSFSLCWSFSPSLLLLILPSSTTCTLFPGSALALLRVKNFRKAERLVCFFSAGKTVGTDPCRRRDGSLGVVDVLLMAVPSGGEETDGNAVTLNEVILILSDWRSCSTATIDGRLVIDDEGKIPSAPIAGGRGLGDVVGRESVGSTIAGGEKCLTARACSSELFGRIVTTCGLCSRTRDGPSFACPSSTTAGGEKYFTTGSGLEAYAESAGSFGPGDMASLSASETGDCSRLVASTSNDCACRSLERASSRVACGVLSSSKTAVVSASISTGSSGTFATGTGFLAMGNDEDLGVNIGEGASELENPAGGSPGDARGEGATEAAAEGAAEPWNRNTFAKSGILKLFIVTVSDFEVSVFFNAGIFSVWIG